MTNMKYFSVPADFKTGTIDQYDELNHTFDGSRVDHEVRVAFDL